MRPAVVWSSVAVKMGDLRDAGSRPARDNYPIKGAIRPKTRFAISAVTTSSAPSPPSREALGARSFRSAGAASPTADDALARDRLVERFLPLARKLARRYQYGREPLDDLVQVASLGLVKAARRYDETRGVPFGSYAVFSINGELKRHLRDHTWAVHVPRGAKDRALQVNHAINAAARSGDVLSARELAARLKLSEQEILEAREAWLALETDSLDGPGWNADEPDAQPASETMGLVDDGYERVDQLLTLEAAWRQLPVRERKILHMRFMEDHRQREIATRIGLSQMQVSRILRSALERLELAAGPE
jgi:RNA polymerase sigma-B factor